jgi:SH3 domain-containing protein
LLSRRIDMANRQVKVLADALNVRKTPSIRGSIIGSLNQDDVVDWLDTSDDEKWLKIQKGDLAGWSSHRFLVPLTPEMPPGPLEEIIQIADTSAISRFDWANRGIAPRGYIKGMAVVYGRVFCKLQAEDDAAIEMAKANTGDRARDALAWYAQKFHDAGMDNEADGVDTLRHLFVLLIGLGMRESSGRYCEGRDRSAENTTANTAEAGLFQTSFNARSASALMPKLFQQYSDNPLGFVDIFKEGVQCRDRDFENFGSGAGRDFQRLSKECPAFAAEFAAVGLRNIRTHWGPINTRAAELRPECNTMLLQVQQAVDTSNLCPI